MLIIIKKLFILVIHRYNRNDVILFLIHNIFIYTKIGSLHANYVLTECMTHREGGNY